MKKILLIFTLILFSVTQITAQSAKKLVRVGEKQLKGNKIQEAKASFTHAIKLDPNMVNAYWKRAEVYGRLGETDLAITDLDMVNKLDVENEVAWLKNANFNYTKKDYKKASQKYAGYLSIEDKDLKIYSKQVECLINIEDYTKALYYAEKKQKVKETPKGFYEIANLHYILKNYKAAEVNFKSAIAGTPNNIEYHNGLALALFFQNRYDDCIGESNIVLHKNKNNKKAYLTRAKAYHKKIEYTSAINDMSNILVQFPDDDDYIVNLNYRGDLYLEFSQHMNAIADFSRVIGKDGSNSYALYKRAMAYEEISRSDDAIADLAKIVELSIAGLAVEESILTSSSTKLFNLRRETNKPSLKLISDHVSDQKIRVTFDTQEVAVSLLLEDENKIKNLSINGEKVEIENNTGKVSFKQSLNIANKEEVKFSVEDIYGNIGQVVYAIQRVENVAPTVSFMLPYTNNNNEMILDADDSRVYFEGSVSDESLIRSIMIDDILIPFNRDVKNPAFTSNIDLREKTKIVVKVLDIYDNTLEVEYYLNREEALFAADSPMGKTWVVFIENSNYESFASLDGPIKDIRLMKTALVNYEIHNTIHLENMSKEQMERFFSMELRDMVKKANVNSLVVWYAGHGKFQNETGYWIPVDADRNDEFSYYNINNLKASMQVYATYLTHTLVITDACESGPSFYQAMRNDIEIRTCADENAVKFKSSQVFSSAGYELATDNSQFTRTFANSLVNNSDLCIPIERIVLNVGDAVSKDNQQKPQFGNISGLEDENGTFFFIKRNTSKPPTISVDTTDEQDN